MKKVFIDGVLTERFELPQDKVHHLMNVLRHSPDKPICIGDSLGQAGIYRIESSTQAGTTVLLEEMLEKAEIQKKIILVQAFLKGERFEWVLQKATELGCYAIYGVETLHCVARYEKKKLVAKETRWQKIITEASQQSGIAAVPIFSCQYSLPDILSQYENSLSIVAYENEDKTSLKECLQSCEADTVLVIIGPEGGFSEKEVAALHEQGVLSASLGASVLRAETAAVTALAMISYEVLM